MTMDPWIVSLATDDHARWAHGLIASRRNSTPRRLAAPGPSREELASLLEAAAAAPDHGQLVPWRFIEVLPAGRAALGEAFRRALLERDESATQAQQHEAAEKAFRSPCLLVAILDLAPRDKAIPPVERSISLGCAIQNMLLLAQAMGYGSGLSSGQAMDSTAIRSTFGLEDDQVATCFISFGTPTKPRPTRKRPGPHEICSRFPAAGSSTDSSKDSLKKGA
jgi:nitroreductase